MRTFLTKLVLGLSLFSLMIASSVHAQAEVNLRIDRVDDTTFPEIRLFTTITDIQGRTIANLQPDSFVLREAGNAISLTNVEQVPAEDVALRVVLALDISKSITADLDRIKASATQFVRSLNPDDEVALVLFGNTARIAQAFTSDHGMITNSILSIGPDQLEDYTALYNGTFESTRLASSGAISGRRVVVLLTDGKNTTPPGSDSLTLTAVQREASDRGIPIYVIGVGPQVSEQELRIIATEGRLLQVDQADELNTAFRELATELRQQYMLTYNSALPADSGAYPLDLTVNAPAGSAETRANLRTRPPETPYLRVQLPDEVERGQPVTLPIEILSQYQPILGEVLFNGEIVLSEALQGRSWEPVWTPTEDLEAGAYTLEIRITDERGNIGGTASDALQLIQGQAGVNIPLWFWIVLGVIVVGAIGTGTALFIRQRNSYASQPLTSPMSTFPYSGLTSPVGAERPPPKTAQSIPNPSVRAKRSNQPIAATVVDGTMALDPGRASLVVERGKASPIELNLRAGKDIVIGRKPDADLVLNDSRASAEHARIRFLEHAFVIADLNSTNGMQINGKRTERVRLQDGDRIEIGGVSIIFKQPKAKG
ncbi:VWA domain-containing protein [Candidatus Chloroploca asiatica]|uniref:FHA domain-containing protein n=1 Tax=Candidatus Chloroploca asiatica TaxID=1506545 RepID=A0A2H3KJP3_9CHLR|nr:VWA domain-containing protein [Candidatus Chloroploca asiatica]PDV98108.1 hypothetical protein A9Q02_03235 [Candidatus Chloroploca asiatica]